MNEIQDTIPTSRFRELLGATPEGLLQQLYPLIKSAGDKPGQIDKIARDLRLNETQLICALGFNPHIRDLSEITSFLGYAGYDELARIRNEYFVNDIYDRLKVDDVLAIYAAANTNMDTLEIMQYLLSARLKHIESRIEQTVNPMIIEKYKKEMKAIYADGIAQIDFAEQRLDNTDSGFRALLNEVGIIVDNKLIPVGDIFFRDTILPEEKRRLLNKGQIPREFVESRLQEDDLSEQERSMLEEYLENNPQ